MSRVMYSMTARARLGTLCSGPHACVEGPWVSTRTRALLEALTLPRHVRGAIADEVVPVVAVVDRRVHDHVRALDPGEALVPG